MTGESEHGLRGDYSHMRADYTVEQDWSAYAPEEHALWRRLYARQAALVPPMPAANSPILLPRLTSAMPSRASAS
jgi:phenylalanine-4-hydroxylase